MKTKPLFLICTRDEALRCQLDHYLRPQGELQFPVSMEEAGSLAEGGGASVLLLDLRIPDSISGLSRLKHRAPGCVFIALAKPNSIIPASETDRLSFFCLLSLKPKRNLVQRLCGLAYEQALLRWESAIDPWWNDSASKPSRHRRRTEAFSGMTFEILQPLATTHPPQLIPLSELTENSGPAGGSDTGINPFQPAGDGLDLLTLLGNGGDGETGAKSEENHFGVGDAVELALRLAGLGGRHEVSRDEPLSTLRGSCECLAGGLACLMMNALETTHPKSDPDARVSVTCRNILVEAKRSATYIRVRGRRRQDIPPSCPSASDRARQQVRLGLATNLLARFEGTLNIESTTDGTCFSVIIPHQGDLS